MSNAFRDVWIRQHVSKQMLTILTYLAKTNGDIVIPITELEKIAVGEAVIQSIDDERLVLHYSPADTKMFVIADNAATERSATTWPTQNARNQLDLLTELTEAGGMTAASSPISTLDDAEMARREQAMKRAAAGVDQARVLRGQPLPVTHPSHLPSQ